MRKFSLHKIRISAITSVSVIILITAYSYVSADVISLTDGSVMNGKLIESTENELTFVNYYGTFKIKKTKIKKFVETSSYTEDIKIKSQMGLNIDEESIKRDYLAGEAEREKKVSKNKYARISLTGSGIFTFGKLKSVLPYGYGCTLDYDHNLFKSDQHVYLPWLRLEGGYSSFDSKDTAAVTGFNVSAGPMWLIPLAPEHFKIPFFHEAGLKLLLAAMPGISFLDIQKKSTDYSTGSNTFTMNSIAGLEIPFGSFAVSLLGRYTYIFDKDVPLHNIGCGIGISYSI